MTNGGNAIDWLKEKIWGPPPAVFGPPPQYIQPRPVMISPPQPQGLPANPAETAALVSGGSHPKGRDSSASLITGR